MTAVQITICLAVALSVPISKCRAQACQDMGACPGLPGRAAGGAWREGEAGRRHEFEPPMSSSKMVPEVAAGKIVRPPASPPQGLRGNGPGQSRSAGGPAPGQGKLAAESGSDEAVKPRSPRRPAIRPKAPAEREDEEEDSEEDAPEQAQDPDAAQAEAGGRGAKAAMREIDAACPNELGLLCAGVRDDAAASLKCLKDNRRALTTGCQEALRSTSSSR